METRVVHISILGPLCSSPFSNRFPYVHHAAEALTMYQSAGTLAAVSDFGSRSAPRSSRGQNTSPT
jgi:hypothetical protein